MFIPIKQTREEIDQRKFEIEQELLELIYRTESDFELDDIKQVIYDEKDQDDLMQIVAMFDRAGDAGELENILELTTDAWNYFPHKALDGLSPAEVSLRYSEQGSNSRE